jgi:hypothetical protein
VGLRPSSRPPARRRGDGPSPISHVVCPMTTTNRVPKRDAANSMLPIWEGATMLPATRMTNRSPNP